MIRKSKVILMVLGALILITISILGALVNQVESVIMDEESPYNEYIGICN